MAKRSREQASKFLKETMSRLVEDCQRSVKVSAWISHYLCCCCCRVRLKEAEEEAFHRVDMEKRIKNLLSLKNNIESNKVCLRTKYYPKFLPVK